MQSLGFRGPRTSELLQGALRGACRGGESLRLRERL